MSDVKTTKIETVDDALAGVKAAMGKAVKAEKWMAGVWWVEDGKIQWHRTSYKFPNSHNDSIGQLAEEIEKRMKTPMTPPEPLPETLDFLSQEELVGANQNDAGKKEEKPDQPVIDALRSLREKAPKEVDPFDGPGAPVVSEEIAISDPVVDGDPTAGEPEGVIAGSRLHELLESAKETDSFTGNDVDKPETKDEKVD